MPQGPNVTDLRTGFAATASFLLTVFFKCFSTYRVQRHRPPSWLFSMSRLCSPQVPSAFDPAFDLVFASFSMCLLFPRRRSRLPHYVKTAEPWRNSLVFLGVLVCHLGSITAASGRLLSFRLPNRGDIVLAGIFGVCLSSLYGHRFRSPPFVHAT